MGHGDDRDETSKTLTVDRCTLCAKAHSYNVTAVGTREAKRATAEFVRLFMCPEKSQMFESTLRVSGSVRDVQFLDEIRG